MYHLHLRIVVFQLVFQILPVGNIPSLARALKGQLGKSCEFDDARARSSFPLRFHSLHFFNTGLHRPRCTVLGLHPNLRSIRRVHKKSPLRFFSPAFPCYIESNHAGTRPQRKRTSQSEYGMLKQNFNTQTQPQK